MGNYHIINGHFPLNFIRVYSKYMEPKTKLILNEITKELDTRFSALIAICESPIEEYFLVNICKYFFSQSLMSLEFNFLTRWIDEPTLTDPCNYQEEGINVFGFIYGIKIDVGSGIIYKIIPQFKHNNYRLDFAIFVEKPNSEIKF